MYRITFAILTPIAIGIMLSTLAMAQQTVHMEIAQLPSYHPTGSDIYIAGSFNGWNPHDEKYKFNKDDQGHYYLNVLLAEGNYEYKITRGGWEKGECRTGGIPSQNRTLKVPIDPQGSGAKVVLTVEEWADRYPTRPKVSTASKNVHIIETAFLIPQLNRTRRIWIYLPEDYYNSPAKRYSVLYMQDGQNVFDDSTAYAGEWGVDEYLDSLQERQCIVVAIDHGGEKRMTEYNPYDNKKFGKGEGKKYTDFLVKTLKPYIDKSYRTIPDKEHTLIAGSSMGGLISMYAVFQYPKVFGAAGVFSPSFWITDTKIFDHIREKGKKIKPFPFIYLYGGRQEGSEMEADIIKAIKVMPAFESNPKLLSSIREEGQHNEASWRLEFPLFYRAFFPRWANASEIQTQH
jgi:predicted alpha/beta superfamily hydrolase